MRRSGPDYLYGRCGNSHDRAAIHSDTHQLKNNLSDHAEHLSLYCWQPHGNLCGTHCHTTTDCSHCDELGINPVHLGIIFLTNLEIGYFMPPVGLNLLISCIRFNKPLSRLSRAAIPFIAIMIIGLFMIAYIPWLSLAFIEHFGIQ